MSQTNDSQKLICTIAMDLKKTIPDKRLTGLWRLMRGFRGIYLGALIAVAAGALMRTLYYRVVQYAIDNVFGAEQHLDRLPAVAAAFVGLAAIEGLFAFLRGTWSAKAAESIALRLRDYLYDHIQRLPFSFHDYAKTGEMIQRSTSDVDALRRFYAEQALGIGRILALFVVNFTMLLQMSQRLALTSVIVMPLVVALSYFFFGKVSKAYKAYQEQEAEVSTVLQENLNGMRVVRAFARQAFEIDKFEKENVKRYRLGKRLLIMHSLYWPFSDTLCSAQMLLSMFVGAMMAIQGEISIGTYVAATGMIVWIVWPLRNLGRLIVQVSTGLVSYRRVMDIVREEREDITTGAVDSTRSIEGAVAFEHVDFAYEPRSVLVDPQDEEKEDGTDEVPDTVPVLHDVTFSCKSGQIVALLGSTGSGKSSVVNLLLRFYDYQEGRILLDGRELTEYPRQHLRKHIGIVEQEPFLFSRSIRDNIAYGVKRELTQDDIEEAARSAAIHDIILTFPEQYNTVVGEKGVTLSGGQRQRVAIARTLLRDPRILILDDATSSVDTETEMEIRQALERLMTDRTTFIIAHRIQTIMHADLILVLDKGHIVQSGSHADLIHQPGLYQRIYDIQSRIEDEVMDEIGRDDAQRESKSKIAAAQVGS
jgi:ATP-binding cassette, subfamily B, bacterial